MVDGRRQFRARDADVGYDEDLRGRAHSGEHLRMRLARLPLTKSARYCRWSAPLPHTIRCLS